ncbi:MAG: DUF2892 domain-containing protein [Asticcacaulis sp.]|nr:DUF2892 domain-containing protein [Asticcacaulis sp.]
MFGINVPPLERLLRVIAGAIIIICALALLKGWPVWLTVATGAFVALTGVVGFCPMCALAGRRLDKRAKGHE